jgi:hypothetical protein
MLVELNRIVRAKHETRLAAGDKAMIRIVSLSSFRRSRPIAIALVTNTPMKCQQSIMIEFDRMMQMLIVCLFRQS